MGKHFLPFPEFLAKWRPLIGYSTNLGEDPRCGEDLILANFVRGSHPNRAQSVVQSQRNPNADDIELCLILFLSWTEGTQNASTDLDLQAGRKYPSSGRLRMARRS